MFAQSKFFGLSMVSMAIYYTIPARIMMPQVGKKHFAYTKKGKKAARKYKNKLKSRMDEFVTSTQGALLVKRKRERSPTDPTSTVSSDLTKNPHTGGVRTTSDVLDVEKAERKRVRSGTSLSPTSKNPGAVRAQRGAGLLTTSTSYERIYNLLSL